MFVDLFEKFHFNLSAISKEITVIMSSMSQLDTFLDEFMTGIRWEQKRCVDLI